MRLEDLKKSIGELSDDELNTLQSEIRQGRRVPTKAPKKERAKKVKEVNIDNISPEAAARMLKILKARKKT